jgi:Alw26I/Eco31I/Esp3I family type II restriction m6 adenine DNA methyltransferase
MPASFVADSTHGALRAFVTNDSSILELASYPAEARLFDGADVHFVTLLSRRQRAGGGESTQLIRFGPNVDIVSSAAVAHPESRSTEWSFPLHPGATPLQILDHIRDLPTLGEVLSTQGYWAGRELDETGLTKRFMPSGVPVLKGRNIQRFSHTADPAMLVEKNLADRFSSVSRSRLVWRDVSRPSQKRRVQATVIPAGLLTGNSLGVLTAPDDEHLYWMLGLFSSAVFESQLRILLTTGHVTLASLRKVRVPWPSSAHFTPIAALARQQSRASTPTLQNELEDTVCMAYGLTPSQRRELFSSYPWLSHSTSSIARHARN